MRINIWMVLAVLLALSPLGSCNLSNKRNASAPIPERLGVPTVRSAAATEENGSREKSSSRATLRMRYQWCMRDGTRRTGSGNGVRLLSDERTGPAENESAEPLSKAGLCRGSVSCVLSAAARQLHGLQN